MVELRLYTLPFVKVCTYCPGINEDIKKLWRIPQVSYHWERDQPKQAEQGWALQPEALEVFTMFMWQSWCWTFTAPHCITSGKAGSEDWLKVCIKIKRVRLWKSTLTFPLQFHLIHLVYTKCTHAQEKHWASGQVTINSSRAFQALRTHKSTWKITINPSSSCHDKCPTLSQSAQTKLGWLLNTACGFVSHPHMDTSNKVALLQDKGGAKR